MTRSAYRRRLDAAEDAGVGFVICVGERAVGRIGLFGEDLLARTAEVGMALLPDRAAAANTAGYAAATRTR